MGKFGRNTRYGSGGITESALLPYLLLGVFLFCKFLTPNLSGCPWWHLKLGQWIVEHHAFPFADPFSYTATHPVVLHEWLGQVISWLVFSKVSPAALAVVFVCMMSASFLIAFGTAWARSRDALVSLIVVMIGATGSAMLSEMRPHVFSFLMFSLMLLVLNRYYHRGDRTIWLLAPLSFVWGNFHGVVLLGLLLIVLEGVICLLAPPAWASERRNPRWAAAKMPFVLALLSGLLVLANPNGSEIYTYSFTLSARYATEGIAEWASPAFNTWIGGVMLALIGLILVSLSAMPTRPKFRDCVHVGFFMVMALMSIRQIPFFVIAGAAPIALWLSSAIQELSGRVEAGRWRLIRKSVWVALAAVVVGLGCWRVDNIDGANVFDYMIAANMFPEAACDFILEQGPPGPMLNDMNYGGYLIYRLWPKYRVFVDTRQGPFLNGAWEEAAGAIYSPNPGSWQRVLEKYGINLICLSPSAPLVTVLVERAEWVIVYKDDLAVVFVRNNAANAELVESFGARVRG